MKLYKKHDPFVRKCLTDLSVAKEFLQNYLPATIKDKCDFSKLSIAPGSYIEDDLKTHASDVVYKIDLKDDAGCLYIYGLIEHQSSAIKLMQYRILRYQMAIIQKHMEEHKGEELPLVMPIVFYNGTDTPYPYSTELSDLFADKELFKQIGLGNFKLVDLTISEDSEISQHKKLAFLEIIVKHIHDKNLDAIIKAFQIAELYQINPALIQGAIYYILSGREREEIARLVAELKQNMPKYGEDIMSYAEELRLEGIQLGEQKGRQEGRQEAQLEIAKEFLKAGVDSKIIATSTHLPLAKIDELKKLLK